LISRNTRAIRKISRGTTPGMCAVIATRRFSTATRGIQDVNDPSDGLA
jgi:hypothetical protein